MKKIFKVNQGCTLVGVQETVYYYDPEIELQAGDEFEVIDEYLDASLEVDGYYIQVISGNFQNEQMIIDKEEIESMFNVTLLKEEEYPVFDDCFDPYRDGYNDGYVDRYKDGYTDEN